MFLSSYPEPHVGAFTASCGAIKGGHTLVSPVLSALKMQVVRNAGRVGRLHTLALRVDALWFRRALRTHNMGIVATVVL